MMSSPDSSKLEVKEGRKRTALPIEGDRGNEEGETTSPKQIRLDSNEISMKETRSENEKGEDPNLMRFRLKNVCDMSEKGVQYEHQIDGFPWMIRMFRMEGLSYRNENFKKESSVEVEVNCEMSRENEFWDCEVEGEVKLINHTDDSHSIIKRFDKSIFSFDDAKPNISIRLGTFAEIIEDENFVVDGAIVIEAKIALKEGCLDRLYKNYEIDFFSPSKISDVILCVEGKKLHVSKQILANASRYFEALFGTSKYITDKGIVMDEVSSEEFLTVLQLIYDTEVEVNDNNVEYLLDLGDRFDIPKVMISVHNFLLIYSKLPVHRRLLIADQFNLFKVQGECIRDMDELMSSDSFNRYSSRLKDVIKDLHHDSESDDFYRLGDKIRDKAGIRSVKRPPKNFASPSSFSDVVFLVGEEKLYAGKQILAHASSYFENYFYDDSEKCGQTEVVIEDFSYVEMLLTLELIYDTLLNIDDRNMEFILKVADRFKITSIVDRVKGRLYAGSTLPNHKQLLIAEQYQLEILKRRCLRSIGYCTQIVDMKNCDSYIHYSSELKIQLFERMVELSECGLWEEEKKEEEEERSSVTWVEEPEEEYLGY